MGFTEDDIINGKNNMPEIWYHDTENKEHRYYGDLFLINQNIIIEVKSSWTYKMHEQINLLKRNACLNAGYNFEFWIYENEKSIHHYDETHITKDLEEEKCDTVIVKGTMFRISSSLLADNLDELEKELSSIPKMKGK